jgi:hypothetical protein
MWDHAFLKSCRNNVDSVFGLLVCQVENHANLALNVAGFPDRRLRQAYDYNIRCADCTSDLSVPILAGEDVLLVEPYVKAFLAKPIVKFPHGRFVTRRMTEKYTTRMTSLGRDSGTASTG